MNRAFRFEGFIKNKLHFMGGISFKINKSLIVLVIYYFFKMFFKFIHVFVFWSAYHTTVWLWLVRDFEGLNFRLSNKTRIKYSHCCGYELYISPIFLISQKHFSVAFISTEASCASSKSTPNSFMCNSDNFGHLYP